LRRDGRGLLLVAGSFDARGGLQRRLENVAALAADHGPATVLTWRRGLKWSRERRADGVEVIRLPALADWERDQGRALAIANTAVSVAVGTVAALLLRRRWHIVFAGGLNPEGVVAGIAARLFARPFVLRTWLPGPFGNVARLEGSPLAPLLRRLLAPASALVAETEEMGEELTAAGFDPTRIIVLDTGLDLDPFTARTAKPGGRRGKSWGSPATASSSTAAASTCARSGSTSSSPRGSAPALPAGSSCSSATARIASTWRSGPGRRRACSRARGRTT